VHTVVGTFRKGSETSEYEIEIRTYLLLGMKAHLVPNLSTLFETR
jgi:hypothetical protein